MPPGNRGISLRPGDRVEFKSSAGHHVRGNFDSWKGNHARVLVNEAGGTVLYLVPAGDLRRR